jgi:hypothetical protein
LDDLKEGLGTKEVGSNDDIQVANVYVTNVIHFQWFSFISFLPVTIADPSSFDYTFGSLAMDDLMHHIVRELSFDGDLG